MDLPGCLKKNVAVQRTKYEQRAREKQIAQADNQRRRKPVVDEELELFKDWYEKKGDNLTLKQLQKEKKIPTHLEAVAADDARKKQLMDFIKYQRRKNKQ